MKFLMSILDILFPPRDTELLVRTLDENSLKNISHSKIITLESKQILTLLPYHLPIVKACIIEAKFHNNAKAQKLLGMLVHDTIRHPKAVFVPIPLGRARQKERGYNQLEKILSSGSLAHSSNILYRNRDTAPQTALGRKERLNNMKGAFGIKDTANPNSVYVLIDDVVTTGATLLAAYDALIESGAKEVFLLALAH
jgi:ComF family protein